MKRDNFLLLMDYIREFIKGSKFENHVFAVGGSVRDLHMGNEIKDIDLVIDIPDGGIDFACWCEDRGATKGKVVVYRNYGTAMFRFSEYPNIEIECVMTRGEKYTDRDSRNPVTTFAPIEEDAVRRDITINALYYNVSTGKTLDLCGGIDDLNKGIIRTTNNNPDIVFDDDPLRIMRVVRFSSRFDMEIDENTLISMKKFSNRLDIISTERIRDEFVKIVSGNNPSYGVRLLHDVGAMKYIVPEFEDVFGLEQNKYHFGDVSEHTLSLLENDFRIFNNGNDYDNVICRLAEFFHDIGKTRCKTIDDKGDIHFYEHEFIGEVMTREIMTRLKFDNKTIDEVCFVVKNHMRTKNFGDNLHKMKVKSINKLIYECCNEKRFGRLARVIECDNLSHSTNHCIKGQYSALMEYSKSNGFMFGYKLPVNGNDLMNELGIKPGPEIKELLYHILKSAFSNPDLKYDSCIKLGKNWIKNKR